MALSIAKPTIQQVRSEVARRLGIPDDGEASPELMAQIRGLIGSTQRQLALEFRHLLPRLTKTLSITSGRTVYPLPCTPEGVVSVSAQVTGSALIQLTMGVSLDDQVSSQPSVPLRYDVRQYQGVVDFTVAGGAGYTNGASLTIGAPGGSGTQAVAVLAASGGVPTGGIITDPGSDYVVVPSVTAPGGTGATITAILGMVESLMLNPAPSAAGSLYVVYRPIPSATVQDTDSLVFDAEAVTAVVAGSLAAKLETAMAPALADQAKVAIDQLRRRVPMRPSGGGLSMVPAGSVRG